MPWKSGQLFHSKLRTLFPELEQSAYALARGKKFPDSVWAQQEEFFSSSLELELRDLRLVDDSNRVRFQISDGSGHSEAGDKFALLENPVGCILLSLSYFSSTSLYPLFLRVKLRTVISGDLTH